MELIRVENLQKTYYLGEVDVPVLHGVSFSIQRGETVALKGASGSGKTTLMNILGCLDRPTSGKYWLDGKEMSELTPDERALVRTAKIGFVFQSFNLLARTSAVNNVLMPLDYAPHRPTHAECEDRARELLGHVGLASRLDHEPSQMSGGQQQRVAIARSLVNRPALILADEPTGNLDSHTSVEILSMFRRLNAEGITVLLVTHDPKVAAWADRTITISDGLIESDETRSEPIAEVGYSANGENGHNGHSAGGWTPSSDGEDGGEVAVAAPVEIGHSRQATLQRAAVTEEIVVEATDEEIEELKVAPRRHGIMSLLPTTLRTAFSALRRNKLRSGLTTLGIVIGIGSVIAMVEIGQGSAHAIEQTIASMGACVLQVEPNWATVGGVNSGAGGRVTLTLADSDAILRECSSVRWAAPSVDTRLQIVNGRKNWIPRMILGGTPSYFLVRDWSFAEGTSFSEEDVRRAGSVCVIGMTPAKALFGDESPIGKKVRVKNVMLTIVGVLATKGANMMGMDQDDTLIAPLTTVKYRLSGVRDKAASTGSALAGANQVNSLNGLYPSGAVKLLPPQSATQLANSPRLTRFADLDDVNVSAISPEHVPIAIEEITKLLRQRHKIADGKLDDFRIRDLTEFSETLASTSRLMTNLLSCVALISLGVGGVGIMNIMLVSVTERTREIGLRMAVGARRHHILRQFLIESIILCLLGGIVGILLGRGASWMVRVFLHWTTMASLPAIIAAVVVSVTVGVVFGFYPAWKASRLDPIEALRYE